MGTTGKLANLRDADTHAVTATVERGGMVLVDFWAEWCGPCRSLEPVIADIASRRPELTVLKVNIEQNGGLADVFEIKSVPTFLLFKDGVCIDRRTGKVPFVELDRMISKNA